MPQISHIKYTDVLEARRYDAEYFKPEYMRELNVLNNYKTKFIGDFAFITDGQHGYHEVDTNSEISHLTARHMKNWFATNEDADRLAQWVDDKNKRSSLEEGDVILSTRGSVGYTALVMKDVLPANIDQDVARIAINEDSKIISSYLLVYLNSYFGQNWINKNTTGMVQQGLSLEKVRQIKIPILSHSFQLKIEEIVKSAYEKQTQSKQLYRDSEEILLNELGLLNYEFKQSLCFTTTKSEIDKAKRYDSEYFQPKYDIIIKKIEDYIGGWDFLGSLTDSQAGFAFPSEKYKDSGVQILRIQNIKDSTIELDSNPVYWNDTTGFENYIVKKNDLIMSMTGGKNETSNVGKSYVYLHEADTLLNQRVLRFRLKNFKKIFLPEILSLIINQLNPLIVRDAGGSIQANISQNQILNLKIPLIIEEIQDEIALKIQESQKLRKESKELLEKAKKAVEIAIEENEERAMEYLQNDKI